MFQVALFSCQRTLRLNVCSSLSHASDITNSWPMEKSLMNHVKIVHMQGSMHVLKLQQSGNVHERESIFEQYRYTRALPVR